MSTIHGLYANAITPVAPRAHTDTAPNQAHEQPASSSFTPVEANQSTDASKSSSDQRPENDNARDNQQNIQAEHNRKQVDDKQESTKAKLELKMEEQLISQLKARDMEVRNHELAHKVVGGKYAGAINLEYTRGPDGVNYATAGEVSISVSPLNDPQMTAQKMRQIQQAALAPAEPSAQDRAVASMAAQIEIQAYTEMAKMERTEQQANEEAKEEIKNDDESMRDRTEPNRNERNNEVTDRSNQTPDDSLSSRDPLSSIDTTLKQSTSDYLSQSTGLNLNVIA